jgi:hypothetical protein
MFYVVYQVGARLEVGKRLVCICNRIADHRTVDPRLFVLAASVPRALDSYSS